MASCRATTLGSTSFGQRELHCVTTFAPPSPLKLRRQEQPHRSIEIGARNDVESVGRSELSYHVKTWGKKNRANNLTACRRRRKPV